MKMVPTATKDAVGFPNMMYLDRSKEDLIWIEIPDRSALLTRDQTEHLIAELESLLRD